ncbi:hypothetical protein [Streptomyces sp. Mg1]|uniref:hypothetical protein n=1 Tax=Streptomyces sp. Mg1 TaxID=465541 RepID=UPI00131A41AF|nr:hypothetical protein [Streptomyces sp. Mg1]
MFVLLIFFLGVVIPRIYFGDLGELFFFFFCFFFFFLFFFFFYFFFSMWVG